MISVCMATYNGQKYIKEQIDSIIGQLTEGDELVISDDGSTDETLKIIRAYSSPKIKLVHHRKNQRLAKKKSASFRFASSNFQNAINNSSGDIIFLADQDDVFGPVKIEKMLDRLRTVDMVMCNYSIIDQAGNVIKKRMYDKSPIARHLINNLLYPPFLGCCMAFRRSVLKYCMPLPYACIGHDFWIGLLVTLKGSFGYIDEPLHMYRKHGNNVSPILERAPNSILFKIAYRLILCYQILERRCWGAYSKRQFRPVLR